MKTLTIMTLTFLLTFSAFAERDGRREGRRNKKDRSARFEHMKEVDDDVSKLSKQDLKKLEGEFKAFQDAQQEKKIAFEKKVFDLREKQLKENRQKVLKHLEEIGELKKKIKFGKKEENKNIRRQIREKSKEFRKKMKNYRREEQRGEIRKMKKEFFEKMKQERQKFKEKIKSYRKK